MIWSHRKSILFSVLLCQSGVCFAQEFCGTSIADQLKIRKAAEASTQKGHESDDLIFVPLQIFNVGDNRGRGQYNLHDLYETLCTLNEDFKASRIQFYLESDIENISNSELNAHTEYWVVDSIMSVHNKSNRINCYIVSNPAGNCGYYTYASDAIALSKSCLGKQSHTWAHEIGHFLGLPHTFFGWENIRYNSIIKTIEYQSRVFTNIETVDRDNCHSQADNFCDTPPDYLSYRWNCNASGFSNQQMRDINDSIFVADGTLFMSYAIDHCMKRFSAAQIAAMRSNLLNLRNRLMRPNVVAAPKLSSEIEVFSPENKTTIFYKNIVFKWLEIPHAKYYLFRISRTPSFSLVVKNLVLQSNEVWIDSLTPNANFYWQVKAINDFDFCGATSVVSSFKTDALSDTKDDYSTEHIGLFPNPIDPGAVLQVFFRGDRDRDVRITIADLSGKTISSVSSPIFKNGTYVFPVEHQVKGVYVVQISTSSNNYFERLVIK